MSTRSPTVSALRSRVNGIVFRIRRGGGQLTVSESSELYSRNRLGADGAGDEWSNPAIIGMEVDAPDQVVSHLIDDYFRPFLDTPGTLVEMGPGGGRFTEPLLDFCGTVIAADTSKTMIEALKSRFAGRPNCVPRLLDGKGLSASPTGRPTRWSLTEFVTRAGLVLEACRGDIATRDSISFISKPVEPPQP